MSKASKKASVEPACTPAKVVKVVKLSDFVEISGPSQLSQTEENDLSSHFHSTINAFSDSTLDVSTEDQPLSSLRKTTAAKSTAINNTSSRSVRFEDEYDFDSQEDVFPQPSNNSTPMRRPFSTIQPQASSSSLQSPPSTQYLTFGRYYLTFEKVSRLKTKYKEPVALANQIIVAIENEAKCNGENFDRFDEDLMIDVVKKVLTLFKPVDFFDCLLSSLSKKMHDSVRHKTVYARKKAQTANQ